MPDGCKIFIATKPLLISFFTTFLFSTFEFVILMVHSIWNEKKNIVCDITDREFLTYQMTVVECWAQRRINFCADLNISDVIRMASRAALENW